MILDRINQSTRYSLPELFQRAFEHSRTLNGNSPVGRVNLLGDDLFGTVSEYRTLKEEETKPETHKKYTDIQIMISGRESMIWYPTSVLPVMEPYDLGRDAAFYKYSPQPGGARIELVPGMFVIFFPWDVHMSQLIAGGKSNTVKKVVYKINVLKLEQYFRFLTKKD